MKFKHFTKEDILALKRIERLNLINSLAGFKSANLIGTADKDGNTNLAIFSSVIHLGSDPALIGFIMRPPVKERHTYDNIMETGCFTINHVHHSFIEKAHYTAVDAEKGKSEFSLCGLQEQWVGGFQAPYLKESKVKIGLALKNTIPIPDNGTILIIGEIQHVYIEGDPLRADGSIDLIESGTVAISGLDHYHRPDAGPSFPYPRLSEIPDFEVEETVPQQVVFNHEKGSYDASLMPFPISIGGPSFHMPDLSLWKNDTVNKATAHFKTRLEEIKGQYEIMVEQFRWNELVYSSTFNFEPVIGESYHLYENDEGERFMSLIPPNSWKRPCRGSFKLGTDRMWIKMDQDC